MDITLEEGEKNLILSLLGLLRISPIDVEAIPVATAAQSLLAKIQPPVVAEVKEEEK